MAIEIFRKLLIQQKKKFMMYGFNNNDAYSKARIVLLAQNKTTTINTDKKLYWQYMITIKSVVNLFEIKISMAICTLNRLCGKFNYFRNFKL